ncbi:Uncharacterised protein [Vibrio cholerae]|nr:Uncharacterised protein [Vibrio cholerae]
MISSVADFGTRRALTGRQEIQSRERRLPRRRYRPPNRHHWLSTLLGEKHRDCHRDAAHSRLTYSHA